MNYKKIVLFAIVAACLSSAIFANKEEVTKKDLEGVSTIAPITVQYILYGKPSEKNGFSQNDVETFKKLKRRPITEKQATFYQQFTNEMLTIFFEKTGKSLVSMNESLLADLPQQDDTKEGIIKQPDRTVVLMAPYLNFDEKDVATLAEAAKRLNVDAVALFFFAQTPAVTVSFNPIKNQEMYKLKCDLYIVSKEGKVILKRDVDSKGIRAATVTGFGGMGGKRVNKTFYEELRASWLESFGKIFK